MAIIRNNKLYIAWCGDSQCCLIKNNNVHYITNAHKPNVQKERERIEKLGGCVTFTSNDWRVSGVLSVARAFGDIDYQPFISSVPDFMEFDLDYSDGESLIIGW